MFEVHSTEGRHDRGTEIKLALAEINARRDGTTALHRFGEDSLESLRPEPKCRLCTLSANPPNTPELFASLERERG